MGAKIIGFRGEIRLFCGYPFLSGAMIYITAPSEKFLSQGPDQRLIGPLLFAHALRN